MDFFYILYSRPNFRVPKIWENLLVYFRTGILATLVTGSQKNTAEYHSNYQNWPPVPTSSSTTWWWWLPTASCKGVVPHRGADSKFSTSVVSGKTKRKKGLNHLYRHLTLTLKLHFISSWYFELGSIEKEQSSWRHFPIRTQFNVWLRQLVTALNRKYFHSVMRGKGEMLTFILTSSEVSQLTMTKIEAVFSASTSRKLALHYLLDRHNRDASDVFKQTQKMISFLTNLRYVWGQLKHFNSHQMLSSE